MTVRFCSGPDHLNVSIDKNTHKITCTLLDTTTRHTVYYYLTLKLEIVQLSSSCCLWGVGGPVGVRCNERGRYLRGVGGQLYGNCETLTFPESLLIGN